MSTPSSTDQHLVRLLNGLSSPYAARRKDDAKTAGRLTYSSEDLVKALQQLAAADTDSGVRQAALTALQAPVHQPVVERLKTQQPAPMPIAPVATPSSGSSTPPAPLAPSEIEITSVLTPATLRQWLAWTQLPPARPASPGEVQLLLKSIKDGSLDDRLEAVDQLRAIKPREAIPDLLKMTGGGLFADRERRVAAIVALGAIGDPVVVPDLMHMKMLMDAEETAICCALAQIGSAAAIPHLKSRIFFPDLSQRAFSAVGLCRTGQVEAVAILIERLPREGGLMVDAAKRLDGVHDRVSVGPFLVKFSGPSAATWLHRSLLVGRVGGAALGTVFARQAVYKNSFGLVNWQLDVATADSAPADMGKMWLYHLWWSALAYLTELCGLDPLLVYRKTGKTSTHRLLVELVALSSRPDDANVHQALATSSTVKDYCERILAYEGWIRLARIGQAAARQRALAGLRDTDTRVRAAVAAVMLAQAAEVLAEEALVLSNDPSADVRSSMLLPVSQLAASGHGPAWDVLQQMASRDADKHVRETAAQISEIIAPDLLMSALADDREEDKLRDDPAPNADRPVSIAAAPKQNQPDQITPALVRTTIYCMKCGTQNAATHKFCLKCGQPLGK
jgi:HEAT repeat protein